MKDLFFTDDLLSLFQQDKHYGNPKNMMAALRKFGLSAVERSDNVEHMYRSLVVHAMDLRGESEPFLEGTFIYPEAVVKLLKEHSLPAPAAMQPASAKSDSKTGLDQGEYEQYFDIVCRNCGTVTDPLASSYRTPIGRLIFKTFLGTRFSLGINATGRYVLEHMTEYDSDHIVSTINEDSVIWKVDESKEKIMSVETISKFVLNFNRELQNLL